MLDLYKEVSAYGPVNADSSQISENEEKAYLLYNKALTDIKSGNEDIAYIKLKKAIGLKEDFYLGKLILGVYQAHIGNYKKAIDYFEDVVNHDKDYGVTALKYLRLLNVDIEKRISEDDSESSLKNEDEYVIKYPKEKNKTGTKVAMLFIGLVAGSLITALFMNYLFGENPNNDGLNNTIDNSGVYVEEINRLSEDIQMLEDELNSLQIEYDEYVEDSKMKEGNSETQELISEFKSFLEIQNLYDEGGYLEAADKMQNLYQIESMLEEEIKDEFYSLYIKTMDQAAVYCEDTGVDLFNSGSYAESIDILEQTTNYRQNYERIYRVIYYIGKNQVELGMYKQAKDSFLEVTSIAPNQEWLNYANQKLAEVNTLIENSVDVIEEDTQVDTTN